MPVLCGINALKASYMESPSAPAKGFEGGKGLESVATCSDWLATMFGAGADFFFDIIEPKPPNMERRPATATWLETEPTDDDELSMMDC